MGRETRDTQTMRDRIREEHTKSPTATLVVRADKEADIQKLVDVLTMGQSLQMKSLIATEQE
jgi:biopolymer transport protein ExbD